MKKKEIIKNTITILGVALSYLILNVSMNIFCQENIAFNYHGIAYLLFTFSYLSIIIMLLYLYPKLGKTIYIITLTINNIYYLAQILHFKILDRFFTFTDIFVADQATGYTNYILKQINIKTILVIIISFGLMILVLKTKTNQLINKRKRLYFLTTALILCICLRGLAILSLGNKVKDDAWNNWNIPHNIYNDYKNPTRSLYTSGLSEYIVRDVYIYLKDLITYNQDKDIKNINNYLNTLNYNLEDNNYTNIFKDKNLIMIMLESIDDWLITEKTMPTLYNLQNKGLNFTNRYSPCYGGGMTINSEFSSQTGTYATVKSKPIFEYKNTYPYSLPSLFKENNYQVNSVHMNTGSFYNRTNFHQYIGFTKHYALMDIINDTDFRYDSNMINNDTSYNYIVNKDKYMTLVTTYSAHLPYTNNDMCKKISNKENYTELECVKFLAKETDNFLKELLNKLDTNNQLDNTVLVLFTDHYLYGYNNVTKIKNINNVNLIQNTPFIIWSKDIEPQKIDTILDTADITPTVLNMFGIKYDPKIYLGTDVFSDYHENFVYFNDYTWYDGNTYYDGTIKDNEYIRDISNKVNNKIKINEKIILTDYYKKISNN